MLIVTQVLDWSSGATYPAIYSVGAVVGVIIMHFLLFGLYKLRLHIYGKCLPTNYPPINTQVCYLLKVNHYNAYCLL